MNKKSTSSADQENQNEEKSKIKTMRARRKKKLVLPKTTYEVGYGKPPAKHQFKPGRSGNPSGRPKGAVNKPAVQLEKIKNRIQQEMSRKVTVQSNRGPIKMSLLDVLLRSLSTKAAKGHVGAAKWLIERAREFEREEKQLQDQLLETIIDYKNDWEIELARRHAKGIRNLAAPVPHPDHIVVDLHTGTHEIIGPRTREEKEEDDALEVQRGKWREDLRRVRDEIKQCMGQSKNRRFNRDKWLAKMERLTGDHSSLEQALQKTERENRYPTRRSMK